MLSLLRCTFPCPQLIRKHIVFFSVFAYAPRMAFLDQFVDERLLHGRAYFDREEALVAVDLNLKAEGLTAAITRLVKKHRLTNLRHGFYLILRPEDQMAGAPDLVRWIDPLMKHQGLHKVQSTRLARPNEERYWFCPSGWRRAGLRQALAERIETPVATLRDWEQGRFAPPGGVLCLLRLIIKHPELSQELSAA